MAQTWYMQHCLNKASVEKAVIRQSHRGGPGSIPGHSMWDLWSKKLNLDTFYSKYFHFPLWIIPPMLHSHLHLHVALTRRKHARSLGACNKQCSFGNRGTLDRKEVSLFFHYSSFYWSKATWRLRIWFGLIGSFKISDCIFSSYCLWFLLYFSKERKT